MNDMSDPVAPRKSWMSLLAKAKPGSVSTYLDAHFKRPDFTWLRPPEIGSVMVQGRAGATGAPFNLGEMTVTRGSLRLEDGQVGHAYVPGRNRDHARIAAICDALMQGARVGEVQRTVIEPLHSAYMARRAQTAGQAEKTRVDFFTMVRGEN